MANTKAIKFTQGNFTYLPVTNASLVQYAYNGGKMSVQDAIGSLAAASLPLSAHIDGEETLSSAANSTSITLTGVHTPGTSSVSLGGDSEITVSGATANQINFAHATHTATASGGTDKAIDGSTNKQSVITGLTVNAYGHVTGYTTANVYSEVQEAPDYSLTYAAIDHRHGNIMNDGKLDAASRVVVTNTGAGITTSSVTTTELGYLSGATSNIQDQIDDLNTTMNSGMHMRGTTTTVPGASTAYVVGDSYVCALTSGSMTIPATQALTGKDEVVTKGDMITYVDGGKWAVIQNNIDLDKYVSSITANAPLSVNVDSGDVTISHIAPTSGTASSKSATGSGTATAVTNSSYIPVVSGVSISKDAYGHITDFDVVTTGLKISYADTHYESKNVVSSTASGTVDETNISAIHFNHVENGVVTSTHKIGGAGITQAYVGDNNVITIYTPAPEEVTVPDIFDSFGAGADVTSKKDGITTNTTTWTPTDLSTIAVRGGNAWIETGVSSTGTLDIGHAVKFASAYSTSKVYNVKIDEAGHISEATVASTGTVGLSALKYTASTADVDDFTLNIGWSNTAVDVAELTGDTTFVKQA